MARQVRQHLAQLGARVVSITPQLDKMLKSTAAVLPPLFAAGKQPVLAFVQISALPKELAVSWQSAGGGQIAAVLISLAQSCWSFGAEPFAYVRDVLDCVTTHPGSRIAELVPDAWKTSRSYSTAQTRLTNLR
jgi:hypothetical protein